MKFVCCQIPTDLPEWVTVERESISARDGRFNYLCRIDWCNEELMETVDGDFDSPIIIDDLLNELGFRAVRWRQIKTRVQDGCYLDGLNKIFPGGIPFRSLLPSISVNHKLCYVINFLSLSKKRKRQVMDVYKGDKTPIQLWALMSSRDLAAVPCDLVEEL
jgi:hypothetical protein